MDGTVQETTKTASDLGAKIEDRTAVAGIIGLGYVGLPLAEHLCSVGYRVLGFDVDETKVSKLRKGESYIRHISSEWIAEAAEAKRFEATTDFSMLEQADCISICVPTPLDHHREPDLQFVEQSARQIARVLRAGQLVILESTTYPGTTQELVLPILEESGLAVGKDFHLAFSPEREDPGNDKFTIKTIPKVVGGVTPLCSSLAAQYYGSIFKQVVSVESPAVAEMSKLLENIYRSVNIALVNELKILCDRMGIDVWKVIEAASTKPFGFMPFYPGPGLGGHCIPIDPFYLTWKAREYGITTRFIELSGEINTSMPRYVIGRVMEALNQQEKTLNGARVLVLGAAYKKDVDDLRESPSLELIALLLERGAKVLYNDPYVPQIRLRHGDGPMLESTDLSVEVLGECDCVLVSTAHSCYDAQFIVDHTSLVVDTRNFAARTKGGRALIVKA